MEYEYLLNGETSNIGQLYKVLNTACELAKEDKVQVIEIVRNKKIKSITNLLD